jgi:hypothetical protein
MPHLNKIIFRRVGAPDARQAESVVDIRRAHYDKVSVYEVVSHPAINISKLGRPAVLKHKPTVNATKFRENELIGVRYILRDSVMLPAVDAVIVSKPTRKTRKK